MIALPDLNAECARLTMLTGRSRTATDAEKKGSMARLAPYRLLPSCYYLFSRYELEEYQSLGPDPLLRRAKRAPSASLRKAPATSSAEFFHMLSRAGDGKSLLRRFSFRAER